VSGIQIVQVKSVDEELRGLPRGLSFFDPILHHEAREELEAGGEAYVSESPEGDMNGLFIYDAWEATGTIFTKSREAFDRFFALKPSSYIFSELDVPELQKEDWNIWQLDVDRVPLGHRFRHHVSMDTDAEEIGRFLAATQPETNPQWIPVALRRGDKCFVTKVDNRIVGMACMTIVGDIARSHGLYVLPQFRRMGIMKDNLQARLIYLKSRRVHTLVNEIAESNIASSEHAEEAGEKIVGKIYLYATPEKLAESAAGRTLERPTLGSGH
jgi:GNAT superfamily N-acetyltransferase